MFRNVILISLASMSLVACVEETGSSDQIQNQKQEQVNKQAVQTVGMPSIVNFQEKRILKDILELRDTQIRTYTYTQDMNGHLHKMCDSVGYGISAATQYTNPQRVANRDETQETGNVVVPQADPNGLYSPASTEGTWVLCSDPNQHKTVPVYIEPRVIVSPFPLSVN